MGMNQSLKLAKLWMALEEIKADINNTAVPLGVNLGLADPALMQAREILSETIDNHFKRFKLVAEPISTMELK